MSEFYKFTVTWKDSNLKGVMKFLNDIMRYTEVQGVVYRDDLSVYQVEYKKDQDYNQITIQTTWSNYFNGCGFKKEYGIFMETIRGKFKSRYGNFRIKPIYSYTGY